MILWALVAGLIAFAYARSTIVWALAGFIFGWPAALLVFFLGVKPGRWEQRMKSLEEFSFKAEEFANNLQEQHKPKEYKDFDTVEDLFKQLESK